MIVSPISIPQQKSIEKEVLFPLVLAPCPSPEKSNDTLVADDLVAYIHSHRDKLVDDLTTHGAIVFRDFNLKNATDFDTVVNQGFGWPALPYVGGAAPRTSVIGTVFTTNESPPDSVIPFHHEMAQVPTYPKRLFFFCELPPVSGGETPLCRSDLAYDAIASEFPSFVADMETHGIIYTRVMPKGDDRDSPIGRGWVSTYGTTDRAQVEATCATLGVTCVWLPNDELKTITAPLPAIKVHPVTGKKVWFNSVLAAYTGWKDSRNDPTKAVLFGNGKALDGEVVTRCCAIMNEVCVDIPWQQGDLFLIDNEMVLHARRTFEPPRKIYAALATLE